MENSLRNPEIPQCKYFVKRKKRLCRMTVRPGRSYCGEHEPEPLLDSGEPDTRVPCPLDPKHTCYASKLEKHLQICNARQTDVPAYIIHNVNIMSEETKVERKPLSEISKRDICAVINKVNSLYDEIISNTISVQPPSPIHPVVTQEYNEPDRGDNSRRHLHQVSTLMKMMQDEGLVQDNHCYVELGAGKGHLSYYICMAWCLQNSSRTVLIDRAALRHKRDNKLKETREEGRVARIRADLAHLSLAEVEAVKDCSGVVGFAKHLCGVASDLAIRCVTEPRILDRTRGVVLATCCHHRCVFSTYVGRKYITEIGITPTEFNIMLGIVSWYTCGDGLSREQRNNQQNEQANKLENSNLQSTISEKDLLANEVNKNIDGNQTDEKNNINSNKNLEEITSQNVGNSLESDTKKTDFSPRKNEITDFRQHKNENTDFGPHNNENTDFNQINYENTDFNQINYENTILLMTREAKEEVGRKAKALIDWGRIEFLKSCGFEARLCHFVPTSVSLENVCIVAKKVV